MPSEAKNQTACHEAGHVIVGMYTKGCNAVQKATIVPHGSSRGMLVQVTACLPGTVCTLVSQLPACRVRSVESCDALLLLLIQPDTGFGQS